MKVDRPVIRGADASEGETDSDWRPRDMRVLRRLAMVVLPIIAIAVAAVIYGFTGRFVSTDNAYVKANIVSLSPEVSGTVQNVLVQENQRVAKGQELIAFDASQYVLGLGMAEVDIRTAQTQYNADKALLAQKAESLRMAQTDASFADREMKRQSGLRAGQFVAVSKLDEVQHTYESAVQKIALLKGEQAEIMARLNGNPDLPLDSYPAYVSGLAKREFAKWYVDHAVIKAPFAGIVSKVPKQGDTARTGVPLLSIVSADVMWVDANFKETEITNMQPGQPAEISVDTYPGHPFKGHIDSIAQASGAEFALLPAQNTTGNWVKVVQRIPVRIAIDEQPGKGPVLRAGMSVTADVDTGVRRIQRWLGTSG